MDDRKSYATVNGKRYPTIIDEDGHPRFPGNRIVRHLLEQAKAGRGYNLNDLATDYGTGLFSKEEIQEFYRLIGYSVCGFSEVFEEDDVDCPEWNEKGKSKNS